MPFEFGSVMLPHFGPFARILAEPLAQFGAGCNVFQPGIELKGSSSHSPGPKSFYQKAFAILSRDRFVCAFELEHLNFCPGVRHSSVGHSDCVHSGHRLLTKSSQERLSGILGMWFPSLVRHAVKTSRNRSVT